MRSFTRTLLSVALAAAYFGLPTGNLSQAEAQVRPGVRPGGGVPTGGVQPAVPQQNPGNFPNRGGPNTNPNNIPNGTNQGNAANGPNQDPNAPNDTPNGPNQNPNAPLPNNLNGNMLDQIPGANIPLGPLAFGSGSNFPWYLPLAGYGLNGYGMNGYGNGYGINGYGNFGIGGYGVQGSPAWANTNGYFGVDGYGVYNLATGQYLNGFGGSAPPVAARLPDAALSDKVQERIRDNEALYQFSNVHQSYRAAQIAQNHAIGETATRVAHESVPRVLSSSEFNGENGKIAWPGPLLSDEYSASRAAIEKALTGLLGDHGTENEAAIRDATREMVEILRSHIEELPADEYMQARKFLDSVEFTAHKFVAR